MTRQRRLLTLPLGLAIAATMTTGIASAATPPNLHNSTFDDRVIPGSVCNTGPDIQLHDGHGTSENGDAVNIGSPVYGDLTGDHRDEAFIHVNCSTTGESKSDDLKNSYVVFTGTSSGVQVLGVIASTHVWRGAQAAGVELRRVKHGVAAVTELLYSSADATCCPSFRATAKWGVKHGELTVIGAKFTITDLLVRASAIGKARLTSTVAQLRHAYPHKVRYLTATSHCTVYRVGSVVDPFTGKHRSITAFVHHGTVVRLRAGASAAASWKGASTYFLLDDLYNDYPGQVTVRGHQAVVRLRHSWLLFRLTTDAGLTYVNAAPQLYLVRPDRSAC